MAQKKLQLVNKNLERIILEKTPKDFVMQRVGRGGMRLSYVETGYVIMRLNKLFNYNWDFEILEEKVGKRQVYVRGKLTGKIYNAKTGGFESIVKTQYGGSDIKFLRNTETPVDYADDLKAAVSDCLKKCASMFGIAQDIFWPRGAEFLEHELEENAELARAVTAPSGLANPGQIAQIKTLLQVKGYSETQLLGKYELSKLEDLTVDQGDTLIMNLRKLPDVTGGTL